MNEYNVDMKTETEQTDVELHIDAEVVAEVPFPVPMDYSHDRLYDRDLPDQHPIKAITGLQDRLDEKVNKEAGKSLMTDAERVKLEGIETGAQVNLIEVIKTNGRLIPIENKTVDLDVDFTGTLGFNVGTRTLTLYGEKGEVLSTAVIPGEQSVGDNTTIVIKGDTVSIAPAVMAKLNDHVASKSNPHGVTKAQVGLGSVDNTADKDKPISTKTQAALNLKADQTELDKTNAEVAKKANQSALDATNVTVGTKADDAGVVHKAGAETVGGQKRFTATYQPIKIANEKVEDYTIPTPLKTQCMLPWIDKKDNVMAYILHQIDDGGFRRFIFSLRDKDNKPNNISVLKPIDSEGWVEIPATPSGSNGFQAVTAGYLNSAPTVVHTTGNETIGGNKIFSGDVTINRYKPTFMFQSTAVPPINIENPDSGNPSKEIWYEVMGCKDSGGNTRGYARFTVTPDGGTKWYFQARNNRNQGIDCGLNSYADGSGDFFIPVPKSDANGREAITAGWANGKYVGLSGDQTIAGYKTFEENILISAPYGRSFRIMRTDWDRLDTNFPAKYVQFGTPSAMIDKNGMTIVGSVLDGNSTYIRYNTYMYGQIGGKVFQPGVVFGVSRPNAESEWSEFTETVTPSADSNGKNIATTAWVNSATSLVHTTGNQTIAGIKVFSINPTVDTIQSYSGIVFRNQYDRNSAPPASRALISYLRFGCKDNDYVASYSVARENDGAFTTGFNVQAIDSTGTQRASANVLAWAYLDGTKYATAPYRESGWRNDEIVTYGMLKTLGLIKG